MLWIFANILFQIFNILDPRMISYLLRTDSVLFETKNFPQQIFGLLWHVTPVIADQSNSATFGKILHFFKKLRMKGKLTWQHKVKDDSQAKSIYFLVIILSIIDLWGYKTRSSSKFLLGWQLLDLILENSKAKINQLDPYNHFLSLVHFNLH